MKSQRQDGGQENETLDMRTLVDWSLPYVIQRPKTIAEIAQMYRSGDARANVGKHRSQILYDQRGRASQKYVHSRVLDRLMAAKNGLPYFD
jgi:hypothetical protein